MKIFFTSAPVWSTDQPAPEAELKIHSTLIFVFSGWLETTPRRTMAENMKPQICTDFLHRLTQINNEGHQLKSLVNINVP